MGFDISLVFSMDEKKELEGVWIDIGMGAEIKVAREMNENFRNETIKRHAELQDEYNLDLMTDERELEEDIKIAAKTIFLGMKNVLSNGKELKDTQENRELVLRNKDMRRIIYSHSRKVSLFRKKLENGVKENLGKS